MVKDIFVKNHIFESQLLPLYGQARRDGFLMDEFIEKEGHDTWRVCRNLVKGSNKKKRRLFEKVTKMVALGNCAFVTLTFRDEVLSKTTESTRRRYVARYLKSQSSTYIANLDFGDKKKNINSNEREHYHAIVLGYVDPKSWKYGFLGAEKIRNSARDLKKVSAYVAKLSLHALKESTTLGCLDSPPRLIYSRDLIG